LHKVVEENTHHTTWTVSTPHLVALVNLAIEKEREACARLCDDFYEYYGYEQIAEAIRARGQA
jgi:hypothetical protein